MNGAHIDDVAHYAARLFGYPLYERMSHKGLSSKENEGLDRAGLRYLWTY